MFEFSLLLLLIGLGAVWYDARRAQETALVECRQACARVGVQLLDDVAPLARIGFMRDERGVLRLRRIYVFEYSASGGDRRRGSIIMLGGKPTALSLEGQTTFDLKPQ